MDTGMELDLLNKVHKYGRVYPKIERLCPDCVMFDADGVLVDACEIHYDALNKAIHKVSDGCLCYEISKADHKARFNGLPTRVKLKMLSDERGLPSVWHERIHEFKQQYTLEKLKQLETQPSQIQLLMALRAMGIKTAMCSNAVIESCIAMTQSTGMYCLLDAIFGNESVKNNKPAADVWLKCADALGVKIENCVIVEDSPIGVESAMTACPRTIVRVDGPSEVNLNLLRKLLV